MAHTLNIYDAAGIMPTIDFVNDQRYSVTHWRPAVAAHPAGDSGETAYDDVAEEITFSVTGDVYAPSEELRRFQMLEECVAAWNVGGGGIGPIILQYRQSAATPLVEAMIVGPAQPGVSMLELPAGFTQSEVTNIIPGLKLRFRRRGVWLAGEESEVTTIGGANPSLHVLNFGSSPAGRAASSFRLSMRRTSGGALEARHMARSFVLISPTMVLIPAKNYTPYDLDFTTPSDAPYSANGNVLRLTPTSTGQKTADFGFIVPGEPCTQFAIFYSYRRNMGFAGGRVWFSGVRGTTSTEESIIPASGSPTPTWAYGGIVTTASTSAPLAPLTLNVVPNSATGSVDFDNIAIVGLSPSGARVVAFTGAPSTSTTNLDMVIDPAPLTRLTPTVHWGTDEYPFAYAGDVRLATAAPSIRAMWLATWGEYWFANGGGPGFTRTWIQFRARRRMGYTIP